MKEKKVTGVVIEDKKKECSHLVLPETIDDNRGDNDNVDVSGDNDYDGVSGDNGDDQSEHKAAFIFMTNQGSVAKALTNKSKEFKSLVLVDITMTKIGKSQDPKRDDSKTKSGHQCQW